MLAGGTIFQNSQNFLIRWVISYIIFIFLTGPFGLFSEPMYYMGDQVWYDAFLYLSTDLLCAPKEVWPRVNVARHPPRRDADVGLVWSQVHARRSFHILRSAQHVRAYRYVHILHVSSNGPSHEEILVVEKVPYYLANGNYCLFYLL